MSSYRTRRATTDDLPQLAELWKILQSPPADLEKRFTEFQVVEDDKGVLVAIIGLRIAGGEGHVHSEVFADFALTDTLRPQLWERLQSVARNHGLFRLWTEETAPFWKKDAGFAGAPAEYLAKLPETFGKPHSAWLLLRLREESAEPSALEREFALFREMEETKRNKLRQRARTVNTIFTILAALLFLSVLLGGIYLLRHKAIILR